MKDNKYDFANHKKYDLTMDVLAAIREDEDLNTEVYDLYMGCVEDAFYDLDGCSRHDIIINADSNFEGEVQEYVMEMLTEMAPMSTGWTTIYDVIMANLEVDYHKLATELAADLCGKADDFITEKFKELKEAIAADAELEDDYYRSVAV